MGCRHKQLHDRPTSRAAFTLIEMIVVISIIILMVAIAVPVVKSLTGNSSISAAQNKVSAMLASARADALYNRQITGMLFFVDPQTTEFAMAEVMQNQIYAPNNSGSAPNPPGFPTSLITQQVYPDSVNLPNVHWPSLEMVYSWQANPNPLNPAASPMTKYYYRDIVALPVGIGVALCNNVTNNQNSWLSNPQPNEYQDRYSFFGAIMFNTDGTLMQMNYSIAGQLLQPYSGPGLAGGVTRADAQLNYPNPNQLSARLQNYGDVCAFPIAQRNCALQSVCGLLLYDRGSYLNQRDQTTGDQFIDTDQPPGTPNTSNLHADLEVWMPPIYGTAGNFESYLPNVNQQHDKYDEESWLDQNGVALLVNPISGALVRSK